MSQPPGSTETVLVTGGTGFVASHLVSQLLDRGYTVRASVRSLANEAKTGPLRRLRAGRGRLELFEADLLAPGSFDVAADGCAYVFHVASPFLLPEQIKNTGSDVIRPAVEGTRNVIAAVERASSVRRLVLTSTVGAIFGDYIDVLGMENQTLSERYFNTTSTPENNPYHYAKTVAEQEAWELAKAQDRWSLVTVNPGLILGPSLVPASDSGSLFLMNELMAGYFFYGAPGFSFTFVDVRDVAAAHVAAAENPAASGRYILARPEMVSMHEMARIIRSEHPRRVLIPRHRVPDAAVRVLGPRFGLTPDYIAKHLGIRFAVDNRRSVAELGVDYRPVRQTMLDHYESWRALRGRRRPAPAALPAHPQAVELDGAAGRACYWVYFGPNTGAKYTRSFSGVACGVGGAGWGSACEAWVAVRGMIVGQNGKLAGMDRRFILFWHHFLDG
jgi:nucleoside-diphosphate-sugar epimerase